MIAGTVRYTDASNNHANLTYNNVYTIISADSNGWIILDDDLHPYPATGASWAVEELYTMTKVV